MHDATTRSTADNPFQQEPEHTHMVIQEIAEANWGFSGLLTDDWKIDSPASRLLRIRTNHTAEHGNEIVSHLCDRAPLPTDSVSLMG